MFAWDEQLYPVVNLESIYAHGKYCQSGLAYKDEESCTEDGCYAKCISIDQISTRNIDEDDGEDPEPYHYYENGGVDNIPFEGAKQCEPN